MYQVEISVADVTAAGYDNSDGTSGITTICVKHGTYTWSCRPLADPGDQPHRPAERPDRGTELAPGPAIADGDIGAIAASIASRVDTYHHPAGTCSMGPDPGGGAVVDARGRVHGIEHLHVADASIMPAIPSANTNPPTIMIAERVASWITAEKHGP